MRAPRVRQPVAELILRGIKTIEVRSVITHVQGPIYVYAGKKRFEREWEQEIAKKYGLDMDALPRGLIVGTVEIVDCLPHKKSNGKDACFTITCPDGLFGWRLARPKRATRMRKPKKQPQPVFFNPF
jgi:hypothetical protein